MLSEHSQGTAPSSSPGHSAARTCNQPGPEIQRGAEVRELSSTVCWHGVMSLPCVQQRPSHKCILNGICSVREPCPRQRQAGKAELLFVVFQRFACKMVMAAVDSRSLYPPATHTVLLSLFYLLGCEKQRLTTIPGDAASVRQLDGNFSCGPNAFLSTTTFCLRSGLAQKHSGP